MHALSCTKTATIPPTTFRALPSSSSASPPSPSTKTVSSSAMPTPVRPLSFLSPYLPYPSLGSTRSYTIIKCLGDGSFGTVWLCDWHGTLPPNTPLSPMQCGAGARPEWAGKRLVAVKLMRRQWAGGWEECQKLKELQVRISVFSTRRISDFPPIQSVTSYNPFPS